MFKSVAIMSLFLSATALANPTVSGDSSQKVTVISRAEMSDLIAAGYVKRSSIKEVNANEFNLAAGGVVIEQSKILDTPILVNECYGAECIIVGTVEAYEYFFGSSPSQRKSGEKLKDQKELSGGKILF